MCLCHIETFIKRAHALLCGDIIMSNQKHPVTEWKTIRISAASYYKLVELSGFLTILFGSQTIPISTIADMTINTFYAGAFPELKDIISDPKKLEEKRKEIGGSLKRLLEVWTKPKFE